MAQRTMTLTLEFDDTVPEEEINGVVNDFEEAIYSMLSSGNYNNEGPGYDGIDEFRLEIS